MHRHCRRRRAGGRHGKVGVPQAVVCLPTSNLAPQRHDRGLIDRALHRLVVDIVEAWELRYELRDIFRELCQGRLASTSTPRQSHLPEGSLQAHHVVVHLGMIDMMIARGGQGADDGLRGFLREAEEPDLDTSIDQRGDLGGHARCG